MSDNNKNRTPKPDPDMDGIDQDDLSYPDVEPDGLGELKSIKRIPNMRPRAPKIQWGEIYKKWPIERRLKYAEELASSMNHAADILQIERNNMIEVAKKQEEVIKAVAKTQTSNTELVQNLTERHNTERQQLNKIIVEIQKELKVAKATIKALEIQLSVE